MSAILSIVQASRVFGLRAALAQWLRDSVMRAKHPLVLRIAVGQPGIPESSLPTLLLVAEMVKQVAI